MSVLTPRRRTSRARFPMTPSGWYAARLRAMTPAEVAYRLGQTLRRQGRRLRAGSAGQPSPLGAPIPQTAPRRVRFLDIDLAYPSREPIDWSRDYKNGVSAPRVFYGDLDYRDVRQVGDSKYTWELNRHQFLVPWAMEYERSGDEESATAVAALILDWIAQNPRYVGINWTSPLEMALRILSWGICLELCAGSRAAELARPSVGVSVAEQAHFIRRTLSRHSSANNHLVGELVGLLAAAALFSEVPACRRHAAFARRALWAEALKQNFRDGVNREQAVYYHNYTLEYLLTASCLLERLGWPTPEPVRDLLRGMLEFVDATSDDAGRALHVGDADDGTVTGLNLGSGVGVPESLLWSAWIAFGDASCGAHAARIARSRRAEPCPDPRTRYWYGPRERDKPPASARIRRRFFPEGGYFVSADAGYTLLFKGGPFGYPSIAAHAHCDQLSVQLLFEATSLLTDSGTYVYHSSDRWRRYFRGTSAHNTVRVDQRDQAEYAGPFLWSSHAEARLERLADSAQGFEVLGRHDGYRRLPDPVSHERRVAYRPGLGYRIADRLAGKGSHLYELFWNFGADVEVQRVGETPLASRHAEHRSAWLVLCAGKPVLGLLLAADSPGVLEARFGDEALPGGFESESYQHKRPAHQICLRSQGSRAAFDTYLAPLDGSEELASLSSLPLRWS